MGDWEGPMKWGGRGGSGGAWDKGGGGGKGACARRGGGWGGAGGGCCGYAAARHMQWGGWALRAGGFVRTAACDVRWAGGPGADGARHWLRLSRWPSSRMVHMQQELEYKLQIIMAL